MLVLVRFCGLVWFEEKNRFPYSVIFFQPTNTISAIHHSLSITRFSDAGAGAVRIAAGCGHVAASGVVWQDNHNLVDVFFALVVIWQFFSSMFESPERAHFGLVLVDVVESSLAVAGFDAGCFWHDTAYYFYHCLFVVITMICLCCSVN